jgi:hypothetical protein
MLKPKRCTIMDIKKGVTLIIRDVMAILKVIKKEKA